MCLCQSVCMNILVRCKCGNFINTCVYMRVGGNIRILHTHTHTYIYIYEVVYIYAYIYIYMYI